MTEQEMRERMKEIDKERSALAFEKKRLEVYFYNKKMQDKAKEHEEYVGKCYAKIGPSKNNRNGYVKAFKILKASNENSAFCLTLIDGYRSTCFHEYGIQIMTLGLWTANTPRMMPDPNDLMMIDFYKEISQEEFEALYREHFNYLENER